MHRKYIHIAVLIIFGFLGVYFSIPLFFGVDFLFGSIFSLLLLQIYGLRWAVLSAVLTNSYTIILWGHPYAWIILSLEILITGLIKTRTNRSLLLSNSIFWILIGIPLILVFYKYLLGVDNTTTLLIMLKQSSNGILNTLFVNIVLITSTKFNHKQNVFTYSFRETLFSIILTLVCIPMVFIMVVEGRNLMNQNQNTITSEMENLSKNLNQHLSSWIQQHLFAVNQLAAKAKKDIQNMNVQNLQRHTSTTKQLFPDFHNMYIADSSATTMAFYPPVNEKGKSTIGLNFSDRNYYKKLKSTHNSVISNVFLGRGGVFSPIITISSPILKDGEFLGYALAALKLEGVNQIIQKYAKKEQYYLSLTDKNDRLIASTIQDLKPLEPYNIDKIYHTQKINDKLYQTTVLKTEKTKLKQHMGSNYVFKSHISGNLGWNLIAEYPVSLQQEKLFSVYIKYFSVVILLILISVLLIGLISKELSAPFIKLTESTSVISKIAQANTAVDLKLPESSIKEIQILSDNFAKMAQLIESTFQGLRENEHYYRSLFHHANEGLSIMSLDGNLVETNQAFATSHGYAENDLINMNISDLDVIEGGTIKTLSRFARRIQNGEIVRFEAEHYHKNGQILSFAITSSMVHIKDKSYYLSFHQDITEQKQISLRLEQAQRMESIGNLAGGIAHDFNNILTPIIGLSEMLVDDLPEGSLQKENAEEILRAGNRGEDLVNQILKFSRQSEHKMLPTRIQHILKEVLKLARSTIPSNIKFRHDLQSNCGLIMADSSQIHQVAMNIITNAYHAVESEGGEISIMLKERVLNGSELPDVKLPSGKYAHLSISDTGHGMPDDLIKKIFDPYFTTKDEGKGTGLGLAVVYGIVKEHKGDIKVFSEIGKGSTFDIYLPLIEKPQLTEPIKYDEEIKGGNEHILLVDDVEAVINLEKQALNRMGYKVTSRLHSIEALEAFRVNPDSFDLVITDMNMPNMTGIQLAEALLSIRSDIPIVICTGFSEWIDKKKAENLGIKDFLMKPIVRAEIAKTVRKVLDDAKGG